MRFDVVRIVHQHQKRQHHERHDHDCQRHRHHRQAEGIDAAHRNQQRTDEGRRHGKREPRRLAAWFVDPPRPPEHLCARVAGVERKLDGRAKATDTQRGREQRNPPAAKRRYEHEGRLIVRIHDDLVRLQHHGTHDEHTHRHDSAEAHAGVSGGTVHPELLGRQLFLDRS